MGNYRIEPADIHSFFMYSELCIRFSIN